MRESARRRNNPQICRYSGSCKYGSGKDGCSYILAFGRSRVKDGHYIVNGKCDAYKRGKYKADGHITCVGYGGFEIDEEYYKLAQKRMDEEFAQIRFELDWRLP